MNFQNFVLRINSFTVYSVDIKINRMSLPEQSIVFSFLIIKTMPLKSGSLPFPQRLCLFLYFCYFFPKRRTGS